MILNRAAYKQIVRYHPNFRRQYQGKQGAFVKLLYPILSPQKQHSADTQKSGIPTRPAKSIKFSASQVSIPTLFWPDSTGLSYTSTEWHNTTSAIPKVLPASSYSCLFFFCCTASAFSFPNFKYIFYFFFLKITSLLAT